MARSPRCRRARAAR